MQIGDLTVSVAKVYIYLPYNMEARTASIGLDKTSRVTYQTAPLMMTFSDLEGNFCFLNHFYLTYLGKYSVYYLR